MVIALAIMDTGFKRYMKIDDGEHKDRTQEILQLSISDQFGNCQINGKNIVNELFTGDKLKEKLNFIDKWYENTAYICKQIECQRRIAKTLYKHKNYYLD